MSEIQTYVYDPHDHGYLKETEGMVLPHGDIDGMRNVANWIHRRRDEGWEVPFVTAEGLLLRYPQNPTADPRPTDHRNHYWFHPGDTLVWTGHEYTDMGAYRLKDDDDE